jgi:DNA-directed RNA polymerase specialized sigma24 family protein
MEVNPQCIPYRNMLKSEAKSIVFGLLRFGEAVEPPPIPKNRWTLTQDAFDLLLAHLDINRQQAGAKYEVLRRKLVKFFEWRGCGFPEDLADDTINRVARKLEAGENILDLPAYCAGVARRVFLESIRSNQQEEAALRMLARSHAAPNENYQRLDCLDRCLRQLSPENLRLILEYYQQDKHARIKARWNQAERLAIPLNALRIRAHRIRLQLERCVQECMRPSDDEETY